MPDIRCYFVFSLDQISNSWNMDDSGEPSQHPHGRVTSIIYLTHSLCLSLSILLSLFFLLSTSFLFLPLSLLLNFIWPRLSSLSLFNVASPYSTVSNHATTIAQIMRVNYAFQLYEYTSDTLTGRDFHSLTIHLLISLAAMKTDFLERMLKNRHICQVIMWIQWKYLGFLEICWSKGKEGNPEIKSVIFGKLEFQARRWCFLPIL